VEDRLETKAEASDLERVLDLDTVMQLANSQPVIISEKFVVVNTNPWNLHKQIQQNYVMH
jgi:hypothetical protein